MDPTLGHPKVFYSSVKHEIYKQFTPETFEAAGIIDPADSDFLEAYVLLREVLGLARPQYTLRQICRTIPMNKLHATIPIATGLTVDEKVKPGIEAEIDKLAWTDVTFALWKNVGHVNIVREAMLSGAFDFYAMGIEDCARDLARAENDQIAAILPGATDQAAGGVWDTFTSGVSDYNPYDDILDALDALSAVGYPANWAVMAPKVWKGFILNSFVRELVHAGIATVTPSGGSFTIPGYPTVKVLVDHAVTPATSCYIFSSNAPAFVLGTGPTEAARYEDVPAGFYGYVIRQWLEPKLVLPTAALEITGAAT